MADKKNKKQSFWDAVLFNRFMPYVASVLFIIIFGGAFIIIYFDSNAIKDQINDDFNEQQLILAKHAQHQVDLFLHDLELEFRTMSNFSSIEDSVMRNRALKSLFERNRQIGLLDVGLLSLDGKLVEYYKSDEAPEINPGEIIASFKINHSSKMKLGSLKIIDRDKSKRPNLISWVTMPISLEGHKETILFSRLNVSKMFKKMLGKLRSGKTGYAWVINQNGITLYHPEREFIGNNIFEARREKKPFEKFTKINNIMKEEMLKGKQGRGMYETFWHRGVEKHFTKLIAYTPVRNEHFKYNNFWSIAVVAPIGEVAEEIEQAYQRHYAAEAAILLGMFLAGLLVLSYQRRVSAMLKETVTEKEEYISSILNNSLDAIIFTDANNKIKVWNKGAEHMFGFTAEEMQEHTFRKIIPPEMDRKKELQKINDEVMKKGYIKNYLTPRITKDGKRLHCNISRTLIRNKEGGILGFTIIVRDDTEKMEMEQRIYNTEKLASLGNLAAGVAHEINNPLAVILGFTDLLKEKFEEGSDEYEDLKLIETNANNAKKIVENLLGFARISEGTEDIVDVKDAIDTVSNIVTNTLLTKKINFETKIPNDLPYIKGDAREFQQVIFNLINNAMAVMKQEGGDLTITAERANDMLRVNVSDTGNGISNRIKQQIFDPFFTTKKVGEGTGLGLSLCYGIVKKYGGSITFYSISKEDYPNSTPGTTFIVSMPVVEEKNDSDNK